MGLFFRDPFPTKQLASPRYNNQLQNIKNSFNKPAVKTPFETPTSNLPKPLVSAGEAIGSIGAGTVTGALTLAIGYNLLTPEPTADEDLILLHKNKGGAPPYIPELFVGDPPQELSIGTPSANFTGGQSHVLYVVHFTEYADPIPGGYPQTFLAWGPITSFGLYDDSHSAGSGADFGVEIGCRGLGGQPSDLLLYRKRLGGSNTDNRRVVLNYLERWDGQPDTDADPPPPQPPINSSSGNTPIPTQYRPPEVGNPQKIPAKNQTPPKFLNPPTPHWPPTIPEQLPKEPIRIPQENTPTQIPSPSSSNPDTAPKIGEPVTLIGPASKIGTIQTTGPFNFTPTAPLSLPTAQPFTPTGPERTPAPQPKVEPNRISEMAPEKSPTEQLKDRVIETGTAIALLTPIIQGIANNTTPDALETAAAAGTCRTTQPGGCSRKMMDDAVGDINKNTNQQFGGLLDRFNTILNGFNASLIEQTWRNTLTINSKLGEALPGGISGFLQRFARSIHLDKIINALTLITALHNAAMLSRNLGSTLGDLTSQALATIGLKDENGSPLDINEEIGRQVNNLMSTILGAETWAGTKLAWNKANTIISSATSIVSTIRSIFDSGREVTEWIANNTGKIGNALKRFRVVGENAYPHMSENVTHQNAWMLKIQRYREGVDSLDDAASSLQGVLGEVQNIQEEFGELKEQKQRFDKAIEDAKPKAIPDNNPVKEKAAAAKAASVSPANTADVFRGEGETTNA